jgi:hypothetical protein
MTVCYSGFFILTKMSTRRIPLAWLCQTSEQKRKSEGFNKCMGDSSESAAKGALSAGPFGAAPRMGGLKCFQGAK